MRKSILIVVFIVFCGIRAFSQLVVVPIHRTPPEKKTISAARTQQDSTATDSVVVHLLTPMPLPYWDDFSFSNSIYYPHDTIWQFGNSVTLNNGIAIHAPSLGVVTFDGLDSLGIPYDIANPLAKGYADNLVSRALRLDLVPPNQYDSVHLSFNWQFYGNGETPDPGDLLSVDFLDSAGNWENQLVIENTGAFSRDTFYLAVLKISKSKFFHSNFQFRMRNYGRLSGPYDTWNVDYVYVNAPIADGKTDFPDRTISAPLTSVLPTYWSMPKKHFLTNIDSNLRTATFQIYNVSATVDQPLAYSYQASVVNYKDLTKDSAFVKLDSVSASDLLPLKHRTITMVSADTLGFASLFDPTADSFKINFSLNLFSGDNVPINFVNPALGGDYDTAIYKPIDFRWNDTLRSVQYLSNYYAYDDGSAEYGIGLNQPGSQVAYQFEMKTPDPDTIVAIDMYFPNFGDETVQYILLQVLRDTADTEESLLYQENIPVTRTAQNKFIRHALNRRTVGVKGSFMIGWSQSSAAVIAMGWDKNTDSGSKLFYNVNGSWEQNAVEHGSMMMRPVFGKGDIPTGIADVVPTDVFPNPNNGTFYLSSAVDQVSIFDMTGRSLTFSQETSGQQVKIELTNTASGIYLVKTIKEGKVMTHKIMVRQ